ncbi:response regulator transcription factor [Streptomyces violascens]|uniref:response regulator transcription factor n=1 Tax=Streptomyces violascens TaxID=67381 RepID=UPI0037A6318E
MQVLAISGDTDFLAEFAAELSSQGFEVSTGNTSEIALERRRDVDLIFLDPVLDDIDGLEVCRAIRAISNIPVIMISTRSDEFDRVLSLKLGADDYIVRPYSLRELTARTQAAIRRAKKSWDPWKPRWPGEAEAHEIGPLRIDVQLRRVTANGREVPLTRKEFDILALLVSDPSRVFTREHIMSEVWGHDGAGDTRTLGVHMSGLRKKLGVPSLIETVRGVGFRLATGHNPLLAEERAG